MTHEERQRVYAALSAPFPDSCIQRTDGNQTGRGYSTTGIAYQFVVNRLNEVLGLGGFRTERTMTTRELTSAKGRPVFEAICELKLQLGEWVDGRFVAFAEAIGDGGHTSVSLADAFKGAFTNGFKKAAAFFGCGRQAYEGTLDDDCVPEESRVAETRPTFEPPPASTPPPLSRHSGQAAPHAPRIEAGQQPEPGHTPAAARNRLTAKQLNALWAISTRLGYEQREFRSYTRETFGVQPEFLTRDQASRIIGTMGNGASPGEDNSSPREPSGRDPGLEG